MELAKFLRKLNEEPVDNKASGKNENKDQNDKKAEKQKNNLTNNKK